MFSAVSAVIGSYVPAIYGTLDPRGLDAHDMLAQQVLNAQQMSALNTQSNVAYRAEMRAADKRRKIQLRGERMDKRLARRRQAIRDKWVERAVAGALLIVIPPVGVIVFAWLWRAALSAVLS